MKKGAVRIIFFSLIAFVLFFSFVNAFSTSDIGKPSNSVDKNYTLGGMITGWINISLDKEPANSLISTNFGDSIGLMDLIIQNEITGGLQYSCSPIDCSSDYSAEGNGADAVTWILKSGEEHIFGLKFTGADFTDVLDFTMKITSNAQESNLKQLFADFGANGLIEWQSHSGSGNYYGENDGCYDVSTGESGITSTSTFCEKIHIPISPSVEIGTYLINPANPTANLVLTIDNEKGDEASCEAQANREGRVSCIPQNFQVNEEGDYYVCIKAKTSADNFKYNINFETGGNICGYATTKTNKKDFQIFASFEKFGAINVLEINSAEALDSGSENDIEYEIKNYISEKYANDCTNDCIVPIRLSSGYGEDQTVTISDVNLIYSSGGEDFQKNGFEIYELSEEPAKISSEYIMLYLDNAGFSLPNKFGNVDLSLNLNNVQLFSKIVEIQKIPQITYLRPLVAIAAFPTEFEAHVETFDSEAEIVSYEWIFGDIAMLENIGGNGGIITTGNKISHVFNQTGQTTITIFIIDSNGFASSKTFNIVVATPKEAVDILLKKNADNLNSVKVMIDGLSAFERDSLNSALDFSNLEAQLSGVQQKDATAISDNDYVSLATELMSIRIPDSVDITKNVESVLFYPPRENINLNMLQKIGGGNYTGDEEAYIDAIVAWELSNTQPRLSSKEFTANYENNNQEVLNIFELSVNENPSIQGAYLIMPKFENLKFDRDYSQKEEQENIYIQLNGGEKIVFSTTENIEFIELPFFISPPLSELSIQKGPLIDTEKISKQTWITLVVLFVTFIGLIIYFVMHQWYKKKYENYLFKNKNDLYNIVSYIQNMKRQGVDDKKVSAGLRKSGWNSEQVTYIMRKYYGKRTGMFEIPFLDLFKRK